MHNLNEPFMKAQINSMILKYTQSQYDIVCDMLDEADSSVEEEVLLKLARKVGVLWQCETCHEYHSYPEDVCCGRSPDGVCATCDGEGNVICDKCDGCGEGAWDGSRCHACGGRGHVTCDSCVADDY